MSQATTWGIPREADEPSVTPETFGIRCDESLDALLSLHSGAARPAYATIGTIWYDTDDGLIRLWDNTNSKLVIVLNAAVPATAVDTGVAGQWAADATHLYQCTATDTWVRVAMATW